MKKAVYSYRLLTYLFTTTLLASCMSFKPYMADKPSGTRDAPQVALQSLLDDAVNEFKLPGIQAGILAHGKLALLSESGTVDSGRRGKAIDQHSSFRIGSTTKLFVAALFCRLAEQGKVNLDDSIITWFPDYPQASSIRVRDLLNQTSGIKESLFTDPGMMVVSLLHGKMLWKPDAVMKTLAKRSRPTPVTERRFVYANNNYVLLGLIAEQVAGKPLSSLLETEFFQPLGMTDTALLPWAQRLPDGPVPGYDTYIPLGPHLIGKKQTSWDSLTFAAGAMSSSANDLLIWLDALFHGKVISKTSLDMMRTWSDARDNGRDNSMIGYGLGLAQYQVGSLVLEGHPGGGFGGECFPFYDPASDTSYVVVYNVSRQDNPAGKEVLNKLIDHQARFRP